MVEKLKKFIEQPEEQSRKFGKEIMSREWVIGDWLTSAGGHRLPYEKEVWLNKKKSSMESMVRIDVFLHEGKPNHFTVSEIKNGELLKSEFNSKLEPVEGTTAPTSLLKEHRANLDEFIGGKFFRHAMGTQEELTTTKILGRKSRNNMKLRILYFPTKIASEMQLENRAPCRFEEGRDSKGDYIVMTPSKTSVMRATAKKGAVAIPQDMLFIAKLELGDYVELEKDGNLFSLRKAEATNPHAVKLFKMGNNVGVPISGTGGLETRVGTHRLWTFGNGEDGTPRLWLELSNEHPPLMRINEYKQLNFEQFSIHMPQDVGEWLKGGDYATLEYRGGKLYIRKKD